MSINKIPITTPTSILNPTMKKPLLSAFMSLVLPGYGQLYNGKRYKGFVLFALFILFSFPLFAIAALFAHLNTMLAIVVFSIVTSLALWLYGIRDAYQDAKQRLNTHQTQHISRFYLILLFMGMLSILLAISHYTRNYYIESFQIPSTSMQPAIIAGDILFVDKRYNCPQCKYSVQRGDIVVFIHPNNRNRYYIKRIIGLAGDTIEMQDRQLFINRQLISKPTQQPQIIEETTTYTHYQTQWLASDEDDDDYEDETINMDRLTVPANTVFVMGDNRHISEDSRDFGAVPLQNVIGKARHVWFSWDKETYQIRWERLGHVLQ